MKVLFCGVGAFAAMLWVSTSALADIIQWDLVGVAATTNPSETITGYFDVDTATGTVTNIDLSLNGFNAGNFLWQYPLTTELQPPFSNHLNAETLANNTFLGIDLYPAGDSSLYEAGTASVALYSYAILVGASNSEFEYLQGSLDGTDVSAVPLPADGWLLLSGLGGIALFARKRLG